MNLVQYLSTSPKKLYLKLILLFLTSYFFLGVSEGSFFVFHGGNDVLVNFLFTLFCVATSWSVFKQVYLHWQTEKQLLGKVIKPLTITGILTLYITLVNWVYIEVYWREQLVNTMFFSIVLPLAIVLFLGWSFGYEILQSSTKAIGVNDQPSAEKDIVFSVQKGKERHQVLIQHVLGFVVENGLVFLVEKQGRKFISEQSMNDLEALLSEHGFFRVNRQFLLIKSAIDAYQPIENEKLMVRLHPGFGQETSCTVSRYKAPGFKRWLNS